MTGMAKPVMTSMLLDTAAVTNLVSQHFTLSMGWEQLKNPPIPNLGGYNSDKSIYIYRAYQVVWKATDHWGWTWEHMTIFYGTGDKQPLLLGSLGLQQIGCQIDMKQQE